MIIFFDVGDVADFVVTPFCYTLVSVCLYQKRKNRLYIIKHTFLVMCLYILNLVRVFQNSRSEQSLN